MDPKASGILCPGGALALAERAETVRQSRWEGGSLRARTEERTEGALGACGRSLRCSCFLRELGSAILSGGPNEGAFEGSVRTEDGVKQTPGRGGA